ncbi:50S ribosomal protein L11 methyltransferase [Apilactobacillus micheneri]|uniref:Ribosomal protein L11 methyltransferase n=1 Tax=Apilactobacillus micheneri TaxID=1899430 RepID=A0A2S2JIU1_9LACO|nr:50S ribosomal protein L11 methyltransferase [Apilactobacillus micheneri]TPR40719.1 50S ribosomal protein L11 methyltransferase [Apilactobacillus micheneri]TPR42186.1 50S ribosomal protein L11 methyltransferase [Apilactobacillus micheneri]TPR44841.1 50S ribosomal protein L11 methyltransferase [Apilactobacillus micheneri]TPR45140.1 50S ribosomal protein L11 methyltransferase [Apilactobacillus micheneri]TPR46482.1 50S ribosomal protein L11 methyltransferase [Apilactobacillus micheneri]
MQWTKLSVLTNNESQDAVINILMDFGSLGVEVEEQNNETVITSYFPENFNINDQIPLIQKRVEKLNEYGLNPGKGKVISKELSDNNWSKEWEKYYHATRITKYLTISPVWEKYKKSFEQEMVIKLNPQKAFGTGVHPTTKLCMQAMEIYLRENQSILDVGTGSGVLSIAAKLMGADSVKAYDYDDDAIESAKINIKLNGYENEIQVTKNSLLDGLNEKSDVILANMLPEAVLPLIPQAKDTLYAGGFIIISGIINEKLDITLQTLQSNDFILDQVMTLGDWRGIVAHLKEEGE